MTSLSPRQMFLLDLACKPVCEAFGAPPFLVGSAVKYRAAANYDGHEPRDVDVRLVLEDRQWQRLHRAIGQPGLAFLGMVIGEYLARVTGLPIDFQIQQQTAANGKHGHTWRNPLGGRRLSDFRGDAAVPDGDA